MTEYCHHRRPILGLTANHSYQYSLFEENRISEETSVYTSTAESMHALAYPSGGFTLEVHSPVGLDQLVCKGGGEDSFHV